jgi:hypothetical protein
VGVRVLRGVGDADVVHLDGAADPDAVEQVRTDRVTFDAWPVVRRPYDLDG